MKRLIYSDTDYFYKTFQDLVYVSDLLEITTDFKSPSEIPERGRRLLRLISGKTDSRPDAVTGPVLNRRYRVTVAHDRFDRIRILVTS
ncbi:MAG: hypothetical protein V1793_19920 [Pseudomonadota bacterium]